MCLKYLQHSTRLFSHRGRARDLAIERSGHNTSGGNWWVVPITAKPKCLANALNEKKSGGEHLPCFGQKGHSHTRWSSNIPVGQSIAIAQKIGDVSSWWVAPVHSSVHVSVTGKREVGQNSRCWCAHNTGKSYQPRNWTFPIAMTTCSIAAKTESDMNCVALPGSCNQFTVCAKFAV